MKIASRSRKPLQSLLATLAIVIMCGLCAGPAQAGYLVTLQQVGPDVVATGTGTVDLTGLTPEFSTIQSGAFMNPTFGVLTMGTTAFTSADVYFGATGPTSFGTGADTDANSGTGDHVSIGGFEALLLLPQGYVSGTALSDSSTYDGKTFSTLGVTAGTYVWSWGTGPNQSFTLQIPTAAVPDSGSTFGLLLLAVATLFGVGRVCALRLA